MQRYPLTEQDRALLSAALDIQKQNLDEGTWNHTVGCALRCQNGQIYRGVNCDGNHGACAEYITMGMAISAGQRDFDTIVAAHPSHPNSILAPCGNCRQMLLEYCPQILVIVNDENGHPIKVAARDLLPFA